MSDVHYPDQVHDWCAAVEDASWWFQHRNRCLLDLMGRYLPPLDAPLYDVGGGNGIVAAALQRAGIKAVVIEPGEAGVRRARERGLEAKQATLETAGFSPGTLGSIGIFDVVEHIEDDVAFLRQAQAFLRPGGRMYVTAPAYQSLWSAEDVHAQHFRRYTTRTLRRALEAAGFEVEHASYIFAFLPLPVLLFRSIPYRLGHARPFSPEAMQRDHAAGPGGGAGRAARRVLNGLLGFERALFRRLGGLPIGGSVVAVARKPHAA